MPTTPCPDCGREVSTAAVSCPQCGRPFGAPTTERIVPRGEGLFLQSMNVGCLIMLALGAMFVGTCVLISTQAPAPKDNRAARAKCEKDCVDLHRGPECPKACADLYW